MLSCRFAFDVEVAVVGVAAESVPEGELVILDAGIATEANLVWLREQGYRYLVFRRGGARQFDPAQAVTIETASGERARDGRAL